VPDRRLRRGKTHFLSRGRRHGHADAKRPHGHADANHEPASASPGRSSAAPSASPVSAWPASAAQIAELTAAANGQCGFTRSSGKLTDVRVTNNGWGSASVTADNPADQETEA
jgi:hypothetical protein